MWGGVPPRANQFLRQDLQHVALAFFRVAMSLVGDAEKGDQGRG